MTNYAKWNNLEVSDSDDDEVAQPKPPPRPAAQSGSGRSATDASAAASVLDRMQRVELLGEEILTDRQQMVELDRRRNKNREALAALRRIDRQGTEAAAAQKHWVCTTPTPTPNPYPHPSPSPNPDPNPDPYPNQVCMGETFAKHSQAEARGML